MTIFSFFSHAKTRIKQAMRQHPLELLFMTVFAVPFWFIDLEHKMSPFAYWLFAPAFWVMIYLLRSTKWYKFSWLIPVLGCVALWYFNDNDDFYLNNPTFWGFQWIMAIMLCSVPFQRENQPYMYHKFNTAFNAGLAFLTGWLVIGIAYAVLSSIEVLFNLYFSEDTVKRLVLFGNYFFTPLFFLVYEQRKSNTMTLNRWLDILLNFVAAPALMLFTLILYSYVSKIIFTGELPKGMVSNIVFPYAIAGLAIYCLRIISAKPRWEIFFRYYPFLAIVPFVLLWLAIERRISDYSWTEERIYLVALAVALSLCYITLLLPKLRQYRNLAIIVIVAIFSMTFVLNPKEIGYKAQNARFEQLLAKLNLLDPNGKIRADFNPPKELVQLSPEQLKDWKSLNNLANFLVYEQPHLQREKEWGWEAQHKVMIEKYGNSFNMVKHLSFYEQCAARNEEENCETKISLDGEVINENFVEVMSYKRELPYNLNINGYQHFMYWSSFSASEDTANNGAIEYCLEDDKHTQCFDLNAMIHDVFATANLDIKQKQTRETLEKLQDEFLTIKDSQTGNIMYLGSFSMRFDNEKGYVFEHAYNVMSFKR